MMSDDKRNSTPSLPADRPRLRPIDESRYVKKPASVFVMLIAVALLLGGAVLTFTAGYLVLNGKSGQLFGFGAFICALLGIAIGKWANE